MMYHHFFQTVFLPPGAIILLLLLGLTLCRFALKLGLSLIFAATLALYFLSTPIVAYFLAKPLQPLPLNLLARHANGIKPQVIVVLGGGRFIQAPEYGRDVSSYIELCRVRYAAYLYRHTKLPILLSGGTDFGDPISEAEVMGDELTQDFNLHARWLENHSQNTAENAAFSTKILKAARIHYIYLVTSASHMRRAKFYFEREGVQVMPAATGFITLSETPGLLKFLPRENSLQDSFACLHEYAGLLAAALLDLAVRHPAG